ncbi:MAG: zf-HC2 domain-containing protein [Candidatus Latescibacterota bacterium]|jgi:anti-sigma factor RsiW
MNSVEPDPRCAWTLARLEAYLDGETLAEELGELETHLAGCAACARQLTLTRQVRQSLRELPRLTCPERVVAAATARLRQRQVASWRSKLSRWLTGWRLPVWQPAAAVGLVLLVALAVDQRDREPEPTAAEVARAEREARFALAYVGQVGRNTGRAVRDQVIRTWVVEPLTRGAREGLHPRGL